MSLPGSPPLLSPGSGAPTPAALYRSAPDALHTSVASTGTSSPGLTNSHSLSPSPRLTSSMLSAFLPGPGGALAGLGNGGAAPLVSGGGAALGPLSGLGSLSSAGLTPGSPGLAQTSSSPGLCSECKLVEVHGVKVASFSVDGQELICLPQVFDLFLKHLVGGLHTVYTKLKRLDIAPVVCTVEQVRVLRGLGAIQPGVNRCKLISRKDFETLYQDCTSARCVCVKNGVWERKRHVEDEGKEGGRGGRLQEVIRSLVKRYVAAMIRSAKTDEGLTEENFKELKQDISSFRYEVLDLLGNRRPPRRNYSSSSETTKDDGAVASEDDSESGDGSGGQKSKGVTFMTPLEDDGAPSPTLGVSALVRSISGMTRMEGGGEGEEEELEEGIGWGEEEEEEEGKPKSNGLKTTVIPPSTNTVLPSPSSSFSSTLSSSLARTRSRLQRLSSPGAKADSFKRLSYLFSRSKRKAPPMPLPLQSPPSYTISDGLLRPLGTHSHSDFGLSDVTRSETHLNEVGRSVDINNPSFSPRRTNGRDSLLTLPLPPPCPCQSLHCASNMSESSSRLLDSSEDVFQGGGVGGAGEGGVDGGGRGGGVMMIGGWVGPCDDVIEDSCEVIEDSVTTQL
ncbi:uncharacterized protein LOC121962477 [Plectropomus leopardus]|uniref:uncharacterized protein LOC121962477 n=1 Tax=Plectropomus leopardus TaxID=160734 RepID=UPI001C4A7E0D|nr:uncharacterized protein LOC121962477 [Plectropomus leopardus]